MTKSLLFFLLSTLLPLQIFSQHALNRSKNIPRPGDHLLKQKVSYKSPGEKGAEVLWDFSDLKPINDNYELKYRSPHSDSDTIIGVGHCTMYYYQSSCDSLFSFGHENPTTYIEYTQFETLLVFPFPYGRSITSYFGGKGCYCKRLYIDIYGKSVVTADAFGMMILPNGDTLQHVLRIHTSKLILEQIHPQSNHTTLPIGTAKIPTCYSDSINKYLANDSTYLQIDKWDWYAEGYRYPIFESINSTICKSNKKYPYPSISFYYPPYEQYYGLHADSENQSTRDNTDRYRQEKLFINDINPIENKNNHRYQDDFIHYICSFNNQEILLNYTINSNADITFCLYDFQGRQLSIIEKTVQNKGNYQKRISLCTFPKGEYLLRIAINNKVYGEKISKQ